MSLKGALTNLVGCSVVVVLEVVDEETVGTRDGAVVVVLASAVAGVGVGTTGRRLR